MYGYNYGYPGNYCCNDNGLSWLWIIIIVFVVLCLFRGGDCKPHC